MAQKAVLVPKQKRSIATKQRIKQTARALFAEHGYYKVTSNTIASTAKLPIGSFYNYFGNKKGVLMELIHDFNDGFHQDTIERNLAIIAATTTPTSVLPNIESFLSNTLLSSYLADPFYRVIHALQFTEADVLELSEEMRRKELDHLVTFLERIHQFYPISDLGVRARLFHATAENVALYIHHLGSDYERDLLIKETARMIFGYVK